MSAAYSFLLLERANRATFLGLEEDHGNIFRLPRDGLNWNELRKCKISHCVDPYYHQYPRFLALRQVQPGFQLGLERHVLRGNGAESGWGGVWEVIQGLELGEGGSRSEQELLGYFCIRTVRTN